MIHLQDTTDSPRTPQRVLSSREYYHAESQYHSTPLLSDTGRQIKASYITLSEDDRYGKRPSTPLGLCHNTNSLEQNIDSISPHLDNVTSYSTEHGSSSKRYRTIPERELSCFPSNEFIDSRVSTTQQCTKSLINYSRHPNGVSHQETTKNLSFTSLSLSPLSISQRHCTIPKTCVSGFKKELDQGSFYLENNTRKCEMFQSFHSTPPFNSKVKPMSGSPKMSKFPKEVTSYKNNMNNLVMNTSQPFNTFENKQEDNNQNFFNYKNEPQQDQFETTDYHYINCDSQSHCNCNIFELTKENNQIYPFEYSSTISNSNNKCTRLITNEQEGHSCNNYPSNQKTYFAQANNYNVKDTNKLNVVESEKRSQSNYSDVSKTSSHSSSMIPSTKKEYNGINTRQTSCSFENHKHLHSANIFPEIISLYSDTPNTPISLNKPMLTHKTENTESNVREFTPNMSEHHRNLLKKEMNFMESMKHSTPCHSIKTNYTSGNGVNSITPNRYLNIENHANCHRKELPNVQTAPHLPISPAFKQNTLVNMTPRTILTSSFKASKTKHCLNDANDDVSNSPTTSRNVEKYSKSDVKNHVSNQSVIISPLALNIQTGIYNSNLKYSNNNSTSKAKITHFEVWESLGNAYYSIGEIKFEKKKSSQCIAVCSVVVLFWKNINALIQEYGALGLKQFFCKLSCPKETQFSTPARKGLIALCIHSLFNEKVNLFGNIQSQNPIVSNAILQGVLSHALWRIDAFNEALNPLFGSWYIDDTLTKKTKIDFSVFISLISISQHIGEPIDIQKERSPLSCTSLNCSQNCFEYIESFQLTIYLEMIKNQIFRLLQLLVQIDHSSTKYKEGMFVCASELPWMFEAALYNDMGVFIQEKKCDIGITLNQLPTLEMLFGFVSFFLPHHEIKESGFFFSHEFNRMSTTLEKNKEFKIALHQLPYVGSNTMNSLSYSTVQFWNIVYYKFLNCFPNITCRHLTLYDDDIMTKTISSLLKFATFLKCESSKKHIVPGCSNEIYFSQITPILSVYLFITWTVAIFTGTDICRHQLLHELDSMESSIFTDVTTFTRRIGTLCLLPSGILYTAGKLFNDSTAAAFTYHYLQFRLSVSQLSQKKRMELNELILKKSKKGSNSKVLQLSPTKLLREVENHFLELFSPYLWRLSQDTTAQSAIRLHAEFGTISGEPIHSLLNDNFSSRMPQSQKRELLLLHARLILRLQKEIDTYEMRIKPQHVLSNNSLVQVIDRIRDNNMSPTPASTLSGFSRFKQRDNCASSVSNIRPSVCSCFLWIWSFVQCSIKPENGEHSQYNTVMKNSDAWDFRLTIDSTKETLSRTARNHKRYKSSAYPAWKYGASWVTAKQLSELIKGRDTENNTIDVQSILQQIKVSLIPLEIASHCLQYIDQLLKDPDSIINLIHLYNSAKNNQSIPYSIISICSVTECPLQSLLRSFQNSVSKHLVESKTISSYPGSHQLIFPIMQTFTDAIHFILVPVLCCLCRVYQEIAPPSAGSVQFKIGMSVSKRCSNRQSQRTKREAVISFLDNNISHGAYNSPKRSKNDINLHSPLGQTLYRLLWREVKTDEVLAEEAYNSGIIAYRSLLLATFSVCIGTCHDIPLRDIQNLHHLISRLDQTFSFRLQCLFLEPRRFHAVIKPIIDKGTFICHHQSHIDLEGDIVNQWKRRLHILHHSQQNLNKNIDSIIISSLRKLDSVTVLTSFYIICRFLIETSNPILCVKQELLQDLGETSFSVLSHAVFALLPSFTSDVSGEFKPLTPEPLPQFLSPSNDERDQQTIHQSSTWIDEARQKIKYIQSESTLQSFKRKMSPLIGYSINNQYTVSSYGSPNSSTKQSESIGFSAYSCRPFHQKQTPNDMDLICSEVEGTIYSAVSSQYHILFIRMLTMAIQTALLICPLYVFSDFIARIFSRLCLLPTDSNRIQTLFITSLIFETTLQKLKYGYIQISTVSLERMMAAITLAFIALKEPFSNVSRHIVLNSRLHVMNYKKEDLINIVNQLPPDLLLQNMYLNSRGSVLNRFASSVTELLQYIMCLYSGNHLLEYVKLNSPMIFSSSGFYNSIVCIGEELIQYTTEEVVTLHAQVKQYIHTFEETTTHLNISNLNRHILISAITDCFQLIQSSLKKDQTRIVDVLGQLQFVIQNHTVSNSNSLTKSLCYDPMRNDQIILSNNTNSNQELNHQMMISLSPHDKYVIHESPLLQSKKKDMPTLSINLSNTNDLNCFNSKNQDESKLLFSHSIHSGSKICDFLTNGVQTELSNCLTNTQKQSKHLTSMQQISKPSSSSSIVPIIKRKNSQNGPSDLCDNNNQFLQQDNNLICDTDHISTTTHQTPIKYRRRIQPDIISSSLPSENKLNSTNHLYKSVSLSSLSTPLSRSVNYRWSQDRPGDITEILSSSDESDPMLLLHDKTTDSSHSNDSHSIASNENITDVLESEEDMDWIDFEMDQLHFGTMNKQQYNKDKFTKKKNDDPLLRVNSNSNSNHQVNNEHKRQRRQVLEDRLNKTSIAPHWRTFIQGLFCSGEHSYK